MVMVSKWWRRLGWGLVATLGLASQLAWRCTESLPDQDLKLVEAFRLDPIRSKQLLTELTRDPHPFGSIRQKEIATHLQQTLRHHQLTVQRQEFTADTPNLALWLHRQRPAPLTQSSRGVNLYAPTIKGQDSCVVLIASHYDSKFFDQIRYVGANDSGSSTVGLVELLIHLGEHHRLQPSRRSCSITGVFFDGEEAILPDWNDGRDHHPAKIVDNSYGSRHSAQSLRPCQPTGSLCLAADLGGERVKALILMDMIGSPQVRLTRESHSTERLSNLAQRLDDQLRDSGLFHHESPPLPVLDDHIPFVQRGIPAIDLIDFEHLDHWHQTSDTIAQISYNSIERVTRLAMAMALHLSE